MLQVRVHRSTESVFATFYEVASATAMRVHINAAGNNIASLGIDDFGSYNVQVMFETALILLPSVTMEPPSSHPLGVRMRPLTNCFNITIRFRVRW